MQNEDKEKDFQDKKKDDQDKKEEFRYKKEHYQTNDSADIILIRSKTLAWYHTDRNFTSAEDGIKYNKYLNIYYILSKILTDNVKTNNVKADNDNMNENLNNEEVFNPTLTFTYKANGIQKTMSVSNYYCCLVDTTTADGAANVHIYSFWLKEWVQL